jgi:hypothetical protein
MQSFNPATPTVGGLLPEDVANVDAWGRRLGYCAYDYGSQPTAAATGRIRGSATTPPNENPTNSSPTDSWVALVVISAGPDGVFNKLDASGTVTVMTPSNRPYCPPVLDDCVTPNKVTVASGVAATGDDMVAARSYGEMVSFGNAQIASSLSGMGTNDKNKLCRLNDSGKMVCDLLPEVPTGAIMAFFRSSAPPGWLECNGAAISNSGDTAALYALIGGNLPDLRGEFIRGWDHGRGVDSSRGLGSWQGYSIQDHTHTLNRVLSNPSFNGDSVEQDQTGPPDGSRSNRIYETGGVSGGGQETRPRNVAFLYAIKK